jgi:phosphoesterase RecJ-like protein
MKELKIEGLTAFLQAKRHIVITNHVNPDGDAMGSALGLSILLKALGHIVNVVVPNDYPDFLKWMAGNSDVVIFENHPEDAKSIVSKADIIFHLDYNAYSRAGLLEETLRESNAVKVMIDHHRQPESWPDYIFSDTDMSSTSQMIYELADIFGWLNNLSKDAADCLYTGIVTDTGSFRFSSTSARTHEIAAHLLQLGVVPNEIYNHVFDTNSISRLRLLGALLDKMQYLPESNAVILHLSKEDQEKYNYKRGDSEGFVNYGLSIAGVNISIFLREDKEVVKTSLRSKGDIDVNALSRANFNGGGHVNAAGGILTMSLAAAITHTQNVISTNKELFAQ